VFFDSDPGAALAGTEAKNAARPAITPAPEDSNHLSMEVNVLRTLYLLRGNDPDLAVGTQHPEQRLMVIKNQFASCPPREDRRREEADISDAYRKVLVELRAALIAEEDERVEELDKQLHDLQQAEDYTLDDGVEITDEARKKALPFVRMHCTADQVVAYLVSYGKDLPNPRTRLFTAMRVKKGENPGRPSPEEWKEIRAFTIREVTWQIGGLNIEKGDKTGTRVGELLDKAYATSDADLKKPKIAAALRQEARAIADQVGPTDLLKHIIQQDLAEMLSNPRLIPAVEARLAYLRVKKA
jgi:hypothetical protein